MYKSGNVCDKPYVLAKVVSSPQGEEENEVKDGDDAMIEVGDCHSGEEVCDLLI